MSLPAHQPTYLKDYACERCEELWRDDELETVRPHDEPSYCVCPECGCPDLIDYDAEYVAKALDRAAEMLRGIKPATGLQRETAFRDIARAAEYLRDYV